MQSANFALLGVDAGPSLGKKGPASDLVFYDRKDVDVIRTWVHPAGFPAKIQPMIQAISMSEFAILYVGNLDRYMGEQIITLDMLGVKRGVLSHTIDVDSDRLESMVRGTIVEGYERATPDEIKEAAYKIEPVQRPGSARIIIDQCFDVKGAGTVILGNVESGIVKQYDKLNLYPSGTEVMIRSIQMHDEPVMEAVAPARVGLAVKGVGPEDAGRGDVLAGEAEMRSRMELDFVKSPFYKGGPSEGQGCLACVGLQIKAAKFASVSPLVLEFEKDVVCEQGQTVLVIKPESDTVRIMGSGSIQ